MTVKVQTINGLVDRSELQATDIISEEENARVTATEWHHNGELVRRDVNVNILRGLDIASEQESI